MKALVSSFVGGWLAVSSVTAETSFISKGASDWKYLDTGEAPGEQWTTLKFDDDAWKTGAAPLGYETDGELALKTTISFGENEEAKHAVAYFRKTFEVADPSELSHFLLRLTADDGAVVHLNGKEVKRLRMPEGAVTEKTFAAEKTGGSAMNYQAVPVKPAALAKGTNVLAVSVHQASGTSSDTHLDLELVGLNDDEFAAAMFPEEMKTITDAYMKKRNAFVEIYQAADESERKTMKMPDHSAEHKAMEELIQSHPSNPGVIEAASWLANTRGLNETVVDVLLAHHSASESDAIVSLLMSGRYQPSEAMLSLLKEVHQKHPKPAFQAIAAQVLANSAESSAEKEALLVDASEKIGDYSINGYSFAEAIKGELFEERNLGIGKVAPEIEGPDIDGVNFKLSDYQGKVVVLDFWGHW